MIETYFSRTSTINRLRGGPLDSDLDDLTAALHAARVRPRQSLTQGQIHGMTIPPSTTLYKWYRFPAEIIRHCVWLYFRFSLSYP